MSEVIVTVKKAYATLCVERERENIYLYLLICLKKLQRATGESNEWLPDRGMLGIEWMGYSIGSKPVHHIPLSLIFFLNLMVLFLNVKLRMVS